MIFSDGVGADGAAVRTSNVIVTGHELVQDRPFGRTTPVAVERLSGIAGPSFVQATREHTPAP